MYRGREGQWAFILHRISGWALMLYLLIHTVSIGSVYLGQDVYNAIHHVYDFFLFRLGLVAIAGAVGFHAFNGIRIILMDFTTWGVRLQSQLFYAVLVLSAVVVAVALAYNVPRILDNDPETRRADPTHRVIAVAPAAPLGGR
jgi:succinate dehydrogenase / fumarate reductase cytochrome b subunit